MSVSMFIANDFTQASGLSQLYRWNHLTGELVFDALEKEGIDQEFECNSKTVRILNSSTISPQLIFNTLYSETLFNKYVGYYPHLERNESDQDWRISILPKVPAVPPFIPEEKYLSTVLGQEVPNNIKEAKQVFVSPLHHDFEEIQMVKEKINKHLLETMQEIVRPKDSLNGIWYCSDFKEHLNTMNIDLSTIPEALLAALIREEDSTSIGHYVRPESKTKHVGYLNQDFFEKTGHFIFRLKSGKSASEAIESIFTSPSLLDCGAAATAACYKAILDTVGKEKFDAFFNTQEGSEDVLIISPHTRIFSNLLSCFCRSTRESKYGVEGSVGDRPVAVGDICYFGGVRYYFNKHPVGYAAGQFALYIGKNEKQQQMFMGHGYEKAFTEEEIQDSLISMYNLERSAADNEAIRIKNCPEGHDPSINEYLKRYYRIKQEDVALYSTLRFSDGWLPYSTQRIESKYVLSLLKAEISEVPRLRQNLLKRRIFASLNVHAGNHMWTQYAGDKRLSDYLKSVIAP